MAANGRSQGDPARSEQRLRDVLGAAKGAGFLGNAPVVNHVDHARALIAAIPDHAVRFVDLGSGGGVPGLIVALDRPAMTGVLVDGSTRRGAFLQLAVDDLGLSDRVEVWAERAERIGRVPEHRGMSDVVLARSFGRPSVVAECAAPLLSIGGTLIVSDPPETVDDAGRWPDADLAQFGLHVTYHHAGPPAFTVLEQHEACPANFPRRVGIPAKRPMF